MAVPEVTWLDVQQAPDDGNRYEAIGGAVYVTPAPSRRHQEVSANLFVALRRLIHESGHGLVYPAPFGVEFPTTREGVQPDIVVVARERVTSSARTGSAERPTSSWRFSRPRPAGAIAP